MVWHNECTIQITLPAKISSVASDWVKCFDTAQIMRIQHLRERIQLPQFPIRIQPWESPVPRVRYATNFGKLPANTWAARNTPLVGIWSSSQVCITSSANFHQITNIHLEQSSKSVLATILSLPPSLPHPLHKPHQTFSFLEGSIIQALRQNRLINTMGRAQQKKKNTICEWCNKSTRRSQGEAHGATINEYRLE